MCLFGQTEEQKKRDAAYKTSPKCFCGAPKYVRRDGTRDYTCRLCFVTQITRRFACEMPYEAYGDTMQLRVCVGSFLEKLVKGLDDETLAKEFWSETAPMLKDFNEHDRKKRGETATSGCETNKKT